MNTAGGGVDVGVAVGVRLGTSVGVSVGRVVFVPVGDTVFVADGDGVGVAAEKFELPHPQTALKLSAAMIRLNFGVYACLMNLNPQSRRDRPNADARDRDSPPSTKFEWTHNRNLPHRLSSEWSSRIVALPASSEALQ